MAKHDYQAIPVEVAKSIADQFDKAMVVILAYDSEHSSPTRQRTA